MHTYQQKVGKGEVVEASIEPEQYHDAHDVVAYAEVNRAVGSKTWPEVWHPDPSGLEHCEHPACAL